MEGMNLSSTEPHGECMGQFMAQNINPLGTREEEESQAGRER
jgi:hypothetical protein